MAPRIAGFRSRADIGLRPPRRVSYNISPERGGCAPHWGGPAPRIRNHADCEQTWRNYQNYHMDTKGWTDVAYTAAYCQHGYALAGRGLGVRTAAQGTNDGNQRFHAFVWLGGEGMTPTGEALDALEWLIVNARNHGTGMRVIPHQAFTGSSCPGPDIIRHVEPLDGQPITPTEEDEVKPEDIEAIAQRVWALEVEGKPAGNRLHDADVRTGEIREAVGEVTKGRNLARDARLLREGVRALAAKAGLTTQHKPPEEVEA